MKYEKKVHMSIKTIDNEVFAFNRSTGVIHSFNGSGGFLIKQIADGQPFEALVNSMVQEYEIDVKTAGEDIKTFLLELNDKGLVTIYDR
jgi:hypothetical protein